MSLFIPVEVDGKVGAYIGTGMESNDKKTALRAIVILNGKFCAVRLEDLKLVSTPKKLARWQRKYGQPVDPTLDD